jgi:hypothetical protein
VSCLYVVLFLQLSGWLQEVGTVVRGCGRSAGSTAVWVTRMKCREEGRVPGRVPGLGVGRGQGRENWLLTEILTVAGAGPTPNSCFCSHVAVVLISTVAWPL